jgi:hypothetical protein
MTTEPTKTFDWGKLGEQFWRDLGATCKASDLQIRFACSAHAGATATGAARLAGYGGGVDAIRQSGYKAIRTTAVVNMLALAAAEDRGAAPKYADKAKRTEALSDMVVSPDPMLRIRAIEALNKMDDRDAELGRAISDDGFSEWRLVRDYLQMKNGGPAILHLWVGVDRGLISLPLLHDVHAAVMRDDLGLWDRLVGCMSLSNKITLNQCLENPEWQLEARVKLWREIGIEIETQADGINGAGISAPGLNGNSEAPALQGAEAN